jgi:hypothetical protein
MMPEKIAYLSMVGFLIFSRSRHGIFECPATWMQITQKVSFRSSWRISPLSLLVCMPEMAKPSTTQKANTRGCSHATLIAGIAASRCDDRKPNQALELTATRRAFTFQMIKTVSVKATLALGGGS